MPRWEPDARTRLEKAALELFAERGYDGTTVADIAERAGLMKRSFFRYFPDKREALFGGTPLLVGHLEQYVTEAPPGIRPWPLLVDALTGTARFFPEDRETARTRHRVVTANPELREREVLKTATLDDLLRDLLTARGTPPRQAAYLVRLALTMYEQAFTHWLTPADPEPDFTECVATAVGDLERVLGEWGDGG
ncbi:MULTISPECIES: TetR family transcriptional regulator [Streptomyces]|uniref:TetR family transcriptional regulator n=2 Tax=Streptomyces TaxID=1883 RepID=A0ABU2RBF9_9ACTN|nr:MULTISPECIES: TetR family transcriptional regulator [unclassified Streptomyces]MDT0413643.1 TetR family transcriptional regulator [Streptomyces sp. DSM 41979]MDT0425727.1 TetR family transcriptional regulator [Streptomyces sp. DSM 41859]MYQ61412.1 TetR family transcriptional regulator [Streptomyces sp. SID4926]